MILDILRSIGWAYLASLWTHLLVNCTVTVVLKPKTIKEHREIDSFGFRIALSCGILVFLLTL